VCKLVSYLGYTPENLTAYDLQTFSGIAAARLRSVYNHLSDLHAGKEPAILQISPREKLEKDLIAIYGDMDGNYTDAEFLYRLYTSLDGGRY